MNDSFLAAAVGRHPRFRLVRTGLPNYYNLFDRGIKVAGGDINFIFKIFKERS